MNDTNNIRKKSVIMMLAAAFLWSTSGAAIKLMTWDSMTLAGIRSLIAGVTILLITRKFKFKMTLRQFAAALAYAASVICIVAATKHTTAANAVLLTYTSPIYTALGAHFFLHERITKKDTLSIAVIIVGLVFFAANGLSTGHWFGDILSALSGLLYAVMLLLMRSECENEPIVCVTWGCFMAFIFSLPFMKPVDVTTQNILLIVFLGVFQLGLSYILYITALKNISVLEANIITVIEPVLNPVWAYLFVGHELPTVTATIGGVIIIIGVLIKEISFRNIHTTKST